MKKLLLILLALNTTIFSIFSMENDNNLWSRITSHLPHSYVEYKKEKELQVRLNNLPRDMQNLIEEFVVTRTLVFLVRDYAHKPQIFFKKVTELMLTNKVAAKVVRFYIPACTNNLDKFDVDESLLLGAADRDWENFWCLILENKNSLEKNLDRDILNQAILYFAINKNKNIVAKLLQNGARKYGANIIIQDEYRVLATPNGINIMEYDVENNKYFSSNTDTKDLLWMAISEKNYPATKLLILNGVDANLSMHLSPLSLASNVGCKNIIKLLIKHGANVNFQDHFVHNLTALMLVVVEGRKDLVKLLIENGADINLQADRGDTALSFASTRGMNRLLIANGAH